MCISPVTLKREGVMKSFIDNYHMMQVPCGKCFECRKARINSWYLRLLIEKESSTSAYFCTLTYDDDKLPFSRNGYMTLKYSDFQNFVKKLRKVAQKCDKPIKYFCAGEYGSHTYRPHYHVIIFNCTDMNEFQTLWNHGFVHIGNVEEASIYYTLKYSLKQILDDKVVDVDDDRVPVKALMSKKLGYGFLTNAMRTYYHNDVSRSVTLRGNVHLPLPRYYRDKIFDESEKVQRCYKMLDYVYKRKAQSNSPLYAQRIKKVNAAIIKTLKQTD